MFGAVRGFNAVIVVRRDFKVIIDASTSVIVIILVVVFTVVMLFVVLSYSLSVLFVVCYSCYC